MYKVIGVDEAGKGPVIGSLFIGFSIINLESLNDLNSYQDMLKELGIKDSKKLTPKKRALVYEKLKDNMDIKYAQLTPALIDDNNFSGGNLFDLEVNAIIQILESEKPKLVIIDALTSNPEKFGDDLLKKLSFECKIISENRADDKYPIVGAASIIAKELREKEIREIKENIHKILNPNLPELEDFSLSPVGSGYPSDPKTCSFLREHYLSKDFGFIFRKSWQTYKNLLDDEKQKVLNNFF